MAVRAVLTYPDPLLKTVCSPVEQLDCELKELVADLIDTLDASPGCVGIAAPQIGVLKRIIVVDASLARRPVENHGRMVLINPVIERQEGEVLGREGCLSLPHLTANVKRSRSIRFRALTPSGSEIVIDSCDFEARIVLHEADHLDGILFLDRVSSLKTDVFRRQRYAPASSPPEYPRKS